MGTVITISEKKEELQVVPAVAPTQQEATLNYARNLLGVSEFSSKRFIKNAIYENFYWKKNTYGQTREQFEAAVNLLLKHHKPTTSTEAKAVRAKEEADKKIRDEFRSKLYRVERAQQLVIDAELASVRGVLRTVYENLNPKERMSFIKIAGNVFTLARREKKAVDMQEAEGRARYEAMQAKEKTIKNALQAYWAEKNETKKKALWKAYLDLTREDRQKKAAEKKAEDKRIAEGLANVESVKTKDPELWSTAATTAAEATVAQAIGRYFCGATLRNHQGNANTYAGSATPNYQKVQQVIITLAGIYVEHKLELLGEDGQHAYRMGFLSDVCKAHNLDEQAVVEELGSYAAALVESNWATILAVGTYLLATGEVKSRKFRSIHQQTAGTDEFRKPAFGFSPTVVSLMVPLPVAPQSEAIMAPTAKGLVN